ncbi:MAG: PBSX family phage terminase large subunit [Fusobacteriaceae bacterium]
MSKLTKKQREVRDYYSKNKVRHLLLDGSVGSGKTKILVVLFLNNVYKHRKKGYKFIIAGATLSTIRRNFLGDMEAIIGKEIKLNKENQFRLFGNTICCFEGKNADAWKKIRGMNSAGTLLGELTTLNRAFVKEAEARTRVADEFILSDTNPDNSLHWVKREYIDRSGDKFEDGTIDILNFNFKIDDNNFLSDNYKQSLRNSYPAGSALYRRNIMGEWVDESEASIYGDYLRNIKFYDRPPFIRNLYVGIDLGINDGTSLVFATVDTEFSPGNKILKVIHHYIDHGKPTMHYIEKIKEFCRNINFRPENVQVILPHDSANRNDGITSLATRYSAYSQHFPMAVKLRTVGVTDMISNTRKHLMDDRVIFNQNLKDFISKLKSYSWTITNGVIDTSKPDHGKEWDSPSNIADSFEYLVFYALGFDIQQTETIVYSNNNNRSYGR